MPDEEQGSGEAGRLATADGLEQRLDVLQEAADSGRLTPEQADDRMQATVDAAEAMAERTGGLRPPRPSDQQAIAVLHRHGRGGWRRGHVRPGQLLIRARGVLILIGLALFIAAGLDPMVRWLTRHRMPRWAAVITILLAATAVVAAFFAAAIPPLSAQVTALTQHLPGYLHALQSHNSELGKLNAKFHIRKNLTNLVHARGTALIGGALGAGELVLSAAGSAFVVAVLSIYFLVGMPRIKLFAYRLVPHSRRTRGDPDRR